MRIKEKGPKIFDLLIFITLVGFLTCCSAFLNNRSSTSTNESSLSKSGSAPNIEEETIKYEAAGVQFTVPSEWKANNENGRYILVSPDKSMTVIVFAPADRSMEAAMAEVGKLVKNKQIIHVDMKGRVIADDMRAQNFYGNGEVSGNTTKWLLTLVSTNAKPLAILTFGDLDNFEKGHVVGQLIASLRKIK